jgi:hypothetical protein
VPLVNENSQVVARCIHWRKEEELLEWRETRRESHQRLTIVERHFDEARSAKARIHRRNFLTFDVLRITAERANKEERLEVIERDLDHLSLSGPNVTPRSGMIDVEAAPFHCSPIGETGDH